MEGNAIVEKTYAFSVRVVRVYQYLSAEKKEHVLSKQVLRCGTSIGANVDEAEGFPRQPRLSSRPAKDTIRILPA
ncbi:MAG: four helix bundle protein [Saprospiraceae bacterium]|nr:MAG: four helix bundle protein [Saprospiraceae bacterium]